ncbi:calcium permeable stress-gated cation channel 1 [[Candida] anglica]
MLMSVLSILLEGEESRAQESSPSNPIPSPTKSTRHARVQIIIALILGLTAFTTFSFLRVRYPKIYVANFNQYNVNYLHSSSRQKLPRLPARSLFGWIPVLYGISEKQVLDHAGLDAVVFLGFFKMCIKILLLCVILAVSVITPIRYKYTRRVDDDDDGWPMITGSKSKHDKDSGEYPQYLWMYTVFTYIFTCIVGGFLFDQTVKIIHKRQKFLGKQNSITDRTVKLLGIPPSLRDETALKRHIERLGVGQVDTIAIVKEWNELNRLFKVRKKVIRQLECYWVEYFSSNGIRNKNEMLSSNLQPQLSEPINLNNQYRDILPHEEEEEEEDEIDGIGSHEEVGAITISGRSPAHDITSPLSTSTTRPASIIDEITDHLENEINEDASLPLLNDVSYIRPKIRTGFLGIFGPKEDAITFYSQQLEVVDKEIVKARKREYPATSAAFVTMKSVAQAQMIAQTVLDPKVNHLITNLAPAPHDIIWDNLCLTRKERNTRIFLVTSFIGLLSIILIFPVSYLAALLNIKTISKMWPKFGELLEANPWAESLVTSLLPTYIFTLFNIVMPYFYIWISSKQGYTSHGDEELSSVSKNFFYIFVNLFLVFTMAGTVTLTNTTEFASQFAQSLKEVSLFYVDLIILQGLGIFPYKLLLLGNLLKFPFSTIFWCKTPRDYLNLYKPPVFNFGLQLPQPILILIITIIYSVLSTKILTAGLIYFIVGFFVFKYQLLYACVHPPHSTGKVWPLIFRRVILGLLIFQLTMVGNLALQKAYVCASFLAPLPLLTFASLWTFQRRYIPLSIFIALRSIENNELPHTTGDTYHDEEALIEGSEQYKTLDERRELNKTYEYPHLIDNLDGPLIAVEGNDMLLINNDGTVRKCKALEEWY